MALRVRLSRAAAVSSPLGTSLLASSTFQTAIAHRAYTTGRDDDRAQPAQIPLFWEKPRTPGKEEADALLSSLRSKGGAEPWASEEDEILIAQLVLWPTTGEEQLKNLAMKLQRPPESVTERLKTLASDPKLDGKLAFTDEFLRSDLSAKEEQILLERMEYIIETLLNNTIGVDYLWKFNLVYQSDNSFTDWAHLILDLIPLQVKHILAASRPPTARELLTLPWSHTQSMGVYGRIFIPRNAEAYQSGHFLYVGTAILDQLGLQGRRIRDKKVDRDWTSDGEKGQNMNGKVRFFDLIVIDPAGKDFDGIREASHLILLAEAALSIWLGALPFEKPGYESWKNIFPWTSEGGYGYAGTFSDNPLIEGTLKHSARRRAKAAEADSVDISSV
ncbi:hypothetical protein PFICI_07030 [Pestalotiopsis fici W106-1]|uniref:Uncharacterized protein n=1 Tax=Pestalotiopsis fici (strain W106-1 / CGMCC3.15140) TaxID=1229662 RepID=W3X7D4_PESFW|nr:uncharacterized protein PFICI_07030 [Pestalotiopsis fici W106-1]ETS82028.1 hypothetical protein PFICI_07030 [Pestalotiopsis fici W106-1]